MAEKINQLIGDYRDGRITRREFMRQAVTLTGSLVAANALLNQFAATDLYAAQVDPSDPALLTHEVDFPGKAGTVTGYLARPSKPGKFPAIIVIHANQGINAYTRDVARRLAKHDYVSLAVDFLSRHGGTTKVNPKGQGLNNIRELEPWQAVAEDADAGYSYLRALPDVRGERLGLVGFCWGGEMTFSTVTQVRGIRAGVVFYGRSPKPFDRMERIEAAMLAHYGEKDPGVNQDIPDTVETMKRYNKPYTHHIYPGAQHGFHSDENPERYHPEAAKEAWARTLEFFKKHLQS